MVPYHELLALRTTANPINCGIFCHVTHLINTSSLRAASLLPTIKHGCWMDTKFDPEKSVTNVDENQLCVT